MKGSQGQHIFSSIILIGIGLYFFLKSYLSLPSYIFSWPTLFIIIGIAMLFQGYGGKQYHFIIPGTLFTGIGLHFHLVNHFNIFTDHIGVIILLIALGYFLMYFKTKDGLFFGWAFLILAIIQLFYDRIFVWLGLLESGLANISNVWPLIFILFGVYIFFFKRK